MTKFLFFVTNPYRINNNRCSGKIMTAKAAITQHNILKIPDCNEPAKYFSSGILQNGTLI